MRWNAPLFRGPPFLTLTGRYVNCDTKLTWVRTQTGRITRAFGIVSNVNRDQMDPRKFEPRILKVTKEALAEGVKVSEIAEQLAPLITRSRFYNWVNKWEKQGKL